MRRYRENRRKGKKMFSRTGAGAHRKNFAVGPMRGGYRI
nr:MAG: hypothetical protein [Microvirus sp.]